jgi:hypothetical protein
MRGGAARAGGDRHAPLGHGCALLRATPDAPARGAGCGVRAGHGGAFLGLAHRRRTLLGFVLVWGALVGWWSTITPSNDRDWQPDVAVLPSATVDGDRVTLHNIRNTAYRTPRISHRGITTRRLTCGAWSRWT